MSDDKSTPVEVLDPEEKFVEVGLTGLDIQGGQVYEEFLPDLKGDKGRKVFREMRDNDPVVGAMLFVIENLVRHVTWSVSPGGASPQDRQAADFLTSCMSDLSAPWSEFIAEVLSMLPFGWAYHEVVYKMRGGQTEDSKTRSRFSDGLIGWRKMPIRAQETLDRWDFDEGGGVRAMIQAPPTGGGTRRIPIEKALLFRTSAHKNNPEGRSVLRNAYVPWYYKNRVQKIEAIGLERDLAGIPLIGVPPELLAKNATPAQKESLEAFKTLGKNVRRDEQHSIIFPLAFDDNGNQLYKFELAGPTRIKQFNTDTIIERYNKDIAIVGLADFILLGHEKVGSLALASSKTHLFAVAIGSYLDSIRDVLNSHAVPKLLAFNPGLTGELPAFVHGDIETPDLKDLAEYISKLAGVGALELDQELEAHLRRVGNLPEKTSE